MKTIRTLSNISYNSLEYFESRINELIANHVIDWCYWIYHDADSDDLKPHIHFVFKPSNRLDTFEFCKFLNEFDPSHPSQPLTCLTKFYFCNSISDWLLYCKHDKAYLLSKGKTRNFSYEWSDFYSTDSDSFNYDVQQIDYAKFHRYQVLLDAVVNHIPFAVIVQSGAIPIAQRAQYEHQYHDLVELYRSGHMSSNGEFSFGVVPLPKEL